MILLIILLSLAIVFDIIDLFCNESGELTITGFLGSLGRGMLIGLGALVVIAAIKMQEEGKTPNAVDVYKGDAEIKIVYTDTIPTDTIVVWKDGRKREW